MNSVIVYKNIDCLITNSGLIGSKGLRPNEDSLGIISKGAVVYSFKRGVLWAGKSSSLPKAHKGIKVVDCKGLVAYPGFVDSHTHPAFDGNRAKEFAMRMEGASYREIAAAGGGILSTVTNTRKALTSKLSTLITKRLERAHRFGVRLMEAKSGYGLEKHAEIRSLNAIEAASKKFRNIEVRSTCLAAHAIPVEYRENRDAWMDELCEDILPTIAKRSLADYVDVFCDEGFYTIEESRRIFTVAKELGFKLKMHGDELVNTGSAELAAEMGALSVDHLLKVSDAGIKALANSDTVATLLPGTALFLKEPPAPARKLIDSGACVALASDFNPGSCTTQNLPFIATLAALHLGMTCPEIIAGITYNGARAMGMANKYGALAVGFLGEPVFAEGDHPAAIYYRLAQGPLPNPRLKVQL